MKIFFLCLLLNAIVSSGPVLSQSDYVDADINTRRQLDGNLVVFGEHEPEEEEVGAFDFTVGKRTNLVRFVENEMGNYDARMQDAVIQNVLRKTGENLDDMFEVALGSSVGETAVGSDEPFEYRIGDEMVNEAYPGEYADLPPPKNDVETEVGRNDDRLFLDDAEEIDLGQAFADLEELFVDENAVGENYEPGEYDILDRMGAFDQFDLEDIYAGEETVGDEYAVGDYYHDDEFALGDMPDFEMDDNEEYFEEDVGNKYLFDDDYLVHYGYDDPLEHYETALGDVYEDDEYPLGDMDFDAEYAADDAYDDDEEELVGFMPDYLEDEELVGDLYEAYDDEEYPLADTYADESPVGDEYLDDMYKDLELPFAKDEYAVGDLYEYYEDPVGGEYPLEDIYEEYDEDFGDGYKEYNEYPVGDPYAVEDMHDYDGYPLDDMEYDGEYPVGDLYEDDEYPVGADMPDYLFEYNDKDYDTPEEMDLGYAYETAVGGYYDYDEEPLATYNNYEEINLDMPYVEHEVALGEPYMDEYLTDEEYELAHALPDYLFEDAEELAVGEPIDLKEIIGMPAEDFAEDAVGLLTEQFPVHRRNLQGILDVLNAKDEDGKVDHNTIFEHLRTLHHIYLQLEALKGSDNTADVEARKKELTAALTKEADTDMATVKKAEDDATEDEDEDDEKTNDLKEQLETAKEDAKKAEIQTKIEDSETKKELDVKKVEIAKQEEEIIKKQTEVKKDAELKNTVREAQKDVIKKNLDAADTSEEKEKLQDELDEVDKKQTKEKEDAEEKAEEINEQKEENDKEKRMIEVEKQNQAAKEKEDVAEKTKKLEDTRDKVIASLKAKVEVLRERREEEARARLKKLKEHDQRHADQTEQIQKLQAQLQQLKEERQQQIEKLKREEVQEELEEKQKITDEERSKISLLDPLEEKKREEARESHNVKEQAETLKTLYRNVDHNAHLDRLRTQFPFIDNFFGDVAEQPEQCGISECRCGFRKLRWKYKRGCYMLEETCAQCDDEQSLKIKGIGFTYKYNQEVRKTLPMFTYRRRGQDWHSQPGFKSVCPPGKIVTGVQTKVIKTDDKHKHSMRIKCGEGTSENLSPSQKKQEKEDDEAAALLEKLKLKRENTKPTIEADPADKSRDDPGKCSSIGAVCECGFTSLELTMTDDGCFSPKEKSVCNKCGDKKIRECVQGIGFDYQEDDQKSKELPQFSTRNRGGDWTEPNRQFQCKKGYVINGIWISGEKDQRFTINDKDVIRDRTYLSITCRKVDYASDELEPKEEIKEEIKKLEEQKQSPSATEALKREVLGDSKVRQSECPPAVSECKCGFAFVAWEKEDGCFQLKGECVECGTPGAVNAIGYNYEFDDEQEKSIYRWRYRTDGKLWVQPEKRYQCLKGKIVTNIATSAVREGKEVKYHLWMKCNDAVKTIPKVPLNGLFAWYKYTGWNAEEGTWKSSVGDFAMKVTKGAITSKTERGDGAEGGMAQVTGTTETGVTFGEIIPEEYTVCTLSRYTNPEQSTQKRVLVGSRGNWLHGHWNGRAGVAIYGEWKTQSKNRVDPNTNWLYMCGQNAQRSIIRANGDSVKQANDGLKGPMDMSINSGGCCESEASDWAVAEIITWNRFLTFTEMIHVEAYFERLLRRGNLDEKPPTEQQQQLANDAKQAAQPAQQQPAQAQPAATQAQPAATQAQPAQAAANSEEAVSANEEVTTKEEAVGNLQEPQHARGAYHPQARLAKSSINSQGMVNFNVVLILVGLLLAVGTFWILRQVFPSQGDSLYLEVPQLETPFILPENDLSE